MGRNIPILDSGKKFKALSGICILSILVSVFVVSGWILNIAALKSVFPNLATMKVNTAFCFMLSGISLLLTSLSDIQNPDEIKIYAAMSKTIALLVILLGASTVFEYVYNYNLGIDNLFQLDKITPLNQFPGRMSQGTATNFVLLGISLLLISVKKQQRVVFAQVLALSVLTISLVAVISYVYSHTALYAFHFFETMALHTALLFILLSLGVLITYLDKGIIADISSPLIGGKIARPLLALAIVLPFLSGWIMVKDIEYKIYSPLLAISFFATLSILVSCVIIWVTAVWLNRSDRIKINAMKDLRSLNEDLEISVAATKRLNRVYAVLSGINNMIVRARDSQKLFDESCRLAVKVGGFRMAWIGLVSPDRNTIIPKANAGFEGGFLHAHESFFDLTSTEHASIGVLTVRSAKPAIRNNIDITKKEVPWGDDALERGYRSAAGLPLVISGEVIGVLSLYSQEPNFFDRNEMQLLEELAADISFSINFINNEKQLLHLAYHEPLTGLSNRTSLYRKIDETILGNRETKLPFALILININNFRNINDTLGHQNGDELIRQVAQRLKSSVWETDITASLGGDVFAVLLSQLSSKKHINYVLNKILGSFQDPFVILDIPVIVEVSLGVAFYPDDGETVDLLWQHADVAQRKANQTHKSYLFYDPGIDHYDPQVLELIGDLPRAINQNELMLHYQPKLDLQAGVVSGVEALIRWQHPKYGLIFPDKFIPPIEKTALIDSLTIWVLDNALRQAYLWRQADIPLSLSVNLSARNLHNPDFKQEILDLISKSQYPLEHLILEITESAIMLEPIQAKEVLAELKEAGITLSVDDFGIGQTSLSYLKELPISHMKIDKSFVMDIKNPNNLAIVRSAIDLGKNLGYSVTAEGIEDEYSFRTLKELGCDYGQGYYFSKPLPSNKLTVWINEYSSSDKYHAN